MVQSSKKPDRQTLLFSGSNSFRIVPFHPFQSFLLALTRRTRANNCETETNHGPLSISTSTNCYQMFEPSFCFLPDGLRTFGRTRPAVGHLSCILLLNEWQLIEAASMPRANTCAMFLKHKPSPRRTNNQKNCFYRAKACEL